MKKPLKPLLWVFILVMSLSLVSVFSSGGCRRAASPVEESVVEEPVVTEIDVLVGVWKEYWGVGEETDVNYNDIYNITSEDGIIKMTCPENPNYDFEDIYFDGQAFGVVLINRLNPEDLYIITYTLAINQDGTELTGKAKTNKGVECNIIWEKIE